jgi:hypothetical protein
MWANIKMRIASKMLGKFGVLPIQSIISFSGQTLLVNGKKADQELATQLIEGAKVLLNSKTRRFVQDRVRFIAADMALNKALSFEQIFFARAAMWYMEQENALLKTLSQETELPGMED